MMGKKKITKKELDKMRLELLDFARELGVSFIERGECGFGRPCVGLARGGNYVDYSPSLSDSNYTPLKDLWDEAVDPPDSVDDAYHKHECFAVLVHDDDYDEAIKQLHVWVTSIKKVGGAKIVDFKNMATGMQVMFSGLIGACLVSKPFWEKLKENVDSLHPSIDRQQFEK